MTRRIRPLAFLDTAALTALSALVLAAASWTKLVVPTPGIALVDPDPHVAVAQIVDTGIDTDERFADE
ncbi:MAG: hypothetical protein H6737_20090 [Alphaproteobacteria bacterium]|nr:hypothetical protein [Alphaproteobacteria bacterium]